MYLIKKKSIVQITWIMHQSISILEIYLVFLIWIADDTATEQFIFVFMISVHTEIVKSKKRDDSVKLTNIKYIVQYAKLFYVLIAIINGHVFLLQPLQPKHDENHIINYFRIICFRYLDNNQITTIQEEAFHDLPSLHTLYVYIFTICYI